MVDFDSLLVSFIFRGYKFGNTERDCFREKNQKKASDVEPESEIQKWKTGKITGMKLLTFHQYEISC